MFWRRFFLAFFKQCYFLKIEHEKNRQTKCMRDDGETEIERNLGLLTYSVNEIEYQPAVDGGRKTYVLLQKSHTLICTGARRKISNSAMIVPYGPQGLTYERISRRYKCYALFARTSTLPVLCRLQKNLI